MCHAQTRVCKCGTGIATLHFGNNILPENIVTELYCPECTANLTIDHSTMLEDNGWVIEFDIEGARLFAHEFPAEPEKVTPEFIFDNGFCTWVGYTPTDQKDSLEEKAAIIELAKTDKKRLADEGWRKAKLAS